MLYIIDIVLQFFHGYYDVGYPVMDPRKIARRYVRSWFAVDCFSAIPIDLILHEKLRAFALVKTVRLLRARKIIQESAQARSSNVLRVLLTLLTWLLLAHWAACIFYALGYCNIPTAEPSPPPSTPRSPQVGRPHPLRMNAYGYLSPMVMAAH